MAVSNEKRELIVKRRQEGKNNVETGKWLGLSERTVRRVWKRYVETGSYAALPANCGRKPMVSVEQMYKAAAKIKEQPDITLPALIDEFNLPIFESALCRRVRALGFRLKKTLHPNGQKREDAAAERVEWNNNLQKINAKKAFFLDETGVNCGMTRLYGRAMSNERADDYVPDVRFERTSVIAAPLAFKGTLDGDFFKIYIEKCPAPKMKKGQTLFLDCLSVHKVSEALDPLIKKGVKIRFLPGYSPDFNSIEPAWSKFKTFPRKAKARNAEDLFTAISDAIDSFTKSDFVHWFRHCGYGL